MLAFGALPFDRSAPSELVVPQVVCGWHEGSASWCTVVAPDRSALPGSPRELRRWLSETGGPRSEPTPGQSSIAAVRPNSSDEQFERIVAEAVDAIDRGELAKVVLARQVAVALRASLDVPALLRRWSRLEPACSVFSMPTAEGQFVGASPELLVERSEGRLRSRPLAGTTGRPPGENSEARSAELLDSPKDVSEHRLVVEAITDALRPLSHDLEAPSRPELVELRSMTHLGTDIAGALDERADGSIPHVLELLAALHPTPAVGGVPAGPARAMIDRLEPGGRGTYAGPVGFVDAAGDGRWVVGIRSMTVRDRDAQLAAGVGIVEGSIPRAERIEADLKLNAVLDALAPGATLPSTTPARASTP